MTDPNARAITVTATATPAACPHPEQARTTRTDHGSYDYVYEVCAACASERLTCQDDDDCGICIDGGKWSPILDPDDVPAEHLEAAGLAGASEAQVDAYLEGRYATWRAAKGEQAGPDVAAPDENPAMHFELDRDTDVHLRCPYCFEVLWLSSDEAPTLGDVIKAANEHKCDEGDGDETAAAAGEESR